MSHAQEIAEGRRFRFGRNWQRFLSVVDEERIREAERSLQAGLEIESLAGRRFLDVGSGSGLFSLAARRLGARVHSFDYDTESVECTRALRSRFFPDDTSWSVEPGSVLDRDYLDRLGRGDVVYAWGVLHHTGDMWQALENVTRLVEPGGSLWIAIYNHRPLWSELDTRLKRTYVRAPTVGKWLIAGGFIAYEASKGLARDLLTLRNPLARYRERKRTRGMSMFHDWIDWVGGYPFETAQPEQIFAFYRERDFELLRLKTVGGSTGCNEFVFRRRGETAGGSAD